MKDRTVAGILAILLGGLGVHRFYLGQIGLGFLYLLFFWTFIPGVIGLVDGIIFLVKPQEEFDLKYNNGKVSPPPPWTQNNTTPRDSADEIAKLHKLMRDGIITIEEFERRKSQLIR